jgi:hypothetical protein
MPLSSKVFLSVFLLVSLGFASWLIRRELRTPQNEREVMDRVIELMQEGRYQKPVQILPAWIDDPRRDASRDGLLYQEMAIAYIAKANRVATGSSQVIRPAALNFGKQLGLYNKENVTSLRLDLLEIGSAPEALADLADKDKCLHYGLAQQEFDRQSSPIPGDFYVADGRKFPLPALCRNIDKQLDAVKEKSSNAGCLSAGKKS